MTINHISNQAKEDQLFNQLAQWIALHLLMVLTDLIQCLSHQEVWRIHYDSEIWTL
jgi:hypothetical protein